MSNQVAQSKQLEIERDGIMVRWDSPQGLEIWIDGVPFMRHMTLYVVKPMWVGRYYGFEDDPDLFSRIQVKETTGSAVRVSLPLQSPHNELSGDVYLVLYPNRRISLGVDVELTTHARAFLEHQFGRIGAAWFMGQPYKAVLSDHSTTEGIAPIVPRSSKINESIVAEHFSGLEIGSPIGAFKMATKGDVRFAVLDFRLNPYADGEKTYWFGVLETPMPTDKRLHYEVTLSFPAATRKASSGVQQFTTHTVELARAVEPAVPPDCIIPTPKALQWHSGVLILPATLPVVVETTTQTARTEIVQLAKDSLEFWLKKVGVSLDFRESDRPANTPCLHLHLNQELMRQAKHGTEPDYYQLNTCEKEIRLQAPTTSGLWAGMRSLIQLLRRSDGGEPAIRRCVLDDYASLPVRAIHFFSGKNARDLQVRMVRDILSLLKINTLVYQCEYVKWDCLKAIHHQQYGMEKSDAAAVRDEARRQHIEIIPLINTFGHMEWLLANDQYRDLADNPNSPYAYDPSNPKVYQLCERIYDEVIEFFSPRTFHIGHDEVTIGGFPQRPQNKKVGATELLVRDIKHYHDFLAKRGIRTMIWGDLFLGPGEGVGACFAESVEIAKKRRARIPKDIIIADWHYDPAPIHEFVSLGILNKDGFDTLACPWYRADNVVQFAKAAANAHRASCSIGVSKNAAHTSERQGCTLGLMQTTWAGYSCDDKSFQGNPEQYSAYVLAAEAAWNGGYDSAAQVPFNYEQEFLRLWGQASYPEGMNGWCANITEAANYLLPRGEGRDTLDVPEGSSMKDFPTGSATLGRFHFLFPKRKEKPAAVLLAAQFNPAGDWPHALTLNIRRKAETLVFAVAATLPTLNKTAIARTIVHYADGQKESIDWRTGGTVFSLDDTRSGAETPILWKNAEPGKAPRVVHGYLWRNPRPKSEIQSLEFRSTEAGPGLILFGVTGVGANEGDR